MISDEGLEKLGFQAVGQRAKQEKALRKELVDGVFPFGVKFLDRVTGGILPTDLVLLGGRSGEGKTELGYTIAASAAKLGKRVHVFALEAEPNEYERRQIYRIIAGMYYNDGNTGYINYVDWMMGKCPDLEKYEAHAAEILEKQTNLHTFYRDEAVFNLQKFTEKFETLEGSSDLVLIDHLHYFDTEDEDENREITRIIQRTRDMALVSRIPVVMIAHIRKKQFNDKRLMPDMEDFQGSSNIYKVPTKIVTIAKAEPSGDGKTYTYMRVNKFRIAGERTDLVAKVQFDSRINSYASDGDVGYLTNGGTVFTPTAPPKWWGDET